MILMSAWMKERKKEPQVLRIFRGCKFSSGGRNRVLGAEKREIRFFEILVFTLP